MRRFIPIVLSFVLALSGWCTFSCFAQAASGKDDHASCHGGKGNHPTAMVVHAHPSVVLPHATPVMLRRPVTFTAPEAAPLQIARFSPKPVHRPLPPLILRL
jgi:hypothetical protein